MKHGQLRTNLFRFEPAVLPGAYGYAQSATYRAAWSLLKDIWNRTKRFNLPTSCLTEMLSILTKGPVWVNPDPESDHSAPAIVSLYPAGVDVVNQALHLWALDALRSANATDFIAADKLLVAAPASLPANQLLPEGGVVPALAYELVPWLVASAMTGSPMSSSVPLLLHLTSDGSLLAWDNPIISEYKQRRALALHGVRPKLVLLRGQRAPFIAIRVYLSHILTQWRHKTRNVWLRANGCVTRLEIYTKRTDEGGYATHYQHPVDRLLGHMGVDGFPGLGIDGSLTAHGDLRPIHANIPSTPLIASGAGPLFLDQACWHLRRTVPGTEPVVADRAIGFLRTATWTGADVSVGSASASQAAGADVSEGSLPVLVVTAHAQTAVRLDRANRLLSGPNQRLTGMRVPGLALHHVCPELAEKMLCGPIAVRQLESWFHDELDKVIRSTGARHAMVETSVDAAQGRAEADPKFPLRRLFAKAGVATQFIFPAEPEETDFAANACVLEVIRQTGVLRSPIRVRALPDETVALSIYVERIRIKGPAVFLPVVTRIRLQDGRPEMFCDLPEAKDSWCDYQTGIAMTHAHCELMTAAEVKHFVARALIAPTDIADIPLIVYCHSGLRAVFDGFRDSGGCDLPSVGTNNAWLVRIRADEDVAQMSGDNVRDSASPGYIGARIGLYKADHGRDLYYFVSPSSQYSRVISQRSNTRFDIVGRALRDPWRQLGVTEIAIIHRGGFATADEIAHQTALFCRNSPVWEGNLRLPAPMHLARQVANDHPAIGIARRIYAKD